MSSGEYAETSEEAQQQTMRRLRRMFTDRGVAGYDPATGPGVACPFCDPKEDASYVHFRQGRDGRYGLAVRGNVTAIEFDNETCLHRWALAFGFHKGATFVSVIRLPDRPNPEDEPYEQGERP